MTVLWYLSWYLLAVLSGIHDIFRGIPLFYSANTHLFGFATTPVPTQFPRDATVIFASFASSSSLQCPRLSAAGRGCRLCNSTCNCVCVPVFPHARTVLTVLLDPAPATVCPCTVLLCSAVCPSLHCTVLLYAALHCADLFCCTLHCHCLRLVADDAILFAGTSAASSHRPRS